MSITVTKKASIKPMSILPAPVPPKLVTPAKAPVAAKPAIKSKALVKTPAPTPVQLIATDLEQHEASPDPIKVTAKQGHMTEHVTYPDGSTADATNDVGKPMVSSAPHATVGLSIGVTHNLGNYESVKFTVSIFLPCAVNADDIDETYNEAKGWVDTRVEALSQEIKDQLSA